MRKINYTLLACISTLLLISCQKELTMDFGPTAGGTSGAILGNWKFLGMHSKTEAIVELRSGPEILKTITRSEYNTINNTGTVQIDSSKMTTTNLGYEVNTMAKGLVYENNVQIDSVMVPFAFVLPPSSAVSSYTKVSADSITFGAGQFISMGASTPLNQPTGVKLKFQGDKLTMTINLSVTDVQSVLGITQTKKETVNAVMTYQRQ